MRSIDSTLVVLLLCRQAVRVDAFSSSSSPHSSAASSPLFRKLMRRVEVSSMDLREQSWAKTEETCVTVSSAKLRDQHRQDILFMDDAATKMNGPALRELGYPRGFCKALKRGTQIYCKRYWLVDDSLSMTIKDGHFLLYTKRSTSSGLEEHLEMAPCTRWAEVQETCLQHSLLALHLGVPTDFRLLNCPQGHFRVPRSFRARGDASLEDVKHCQKILSRVKPSGCTPLRKRLRIVHDEIRSVLPKLGRGQKVALVLATDGLPTEATDEGVSTPLAKDNFKKALQALPPQVSVVIRLCTDDEDVVDYYHDLETGLPNVAVLDDYWAEAARVHSFNPWLTYGLVLHRVREMAGCAHLPLLKELSRRSLTPTEVAEFCQFVFGWETTPDSWEGVRLAVDRSNQETETVWNPIRSQLEPWVDLDKCY